MKINQSCAILLFAIMILIPTLLLATEIELGRSKSNIQVVELFSSEGCSSCPPAEKALSDLAGEAGIWTKFIPVNFHVDYWNQLGWIDRFSNQKYTLRQNFYSIEWGVPRIYTPEFVINGKELGAQWRSDALSNQELPANRDLIFTVKQQGARLKIQIDYPLIQTTAQLHVALLGNGLQTEVKAGENKGRNLKYNFVVLDYQTNSLNIKTGVNVTTYSDLVIPKSLKAKSYAVAIWISRGPTGKIYSAFGKELVLPEGPKT